MQEPRGPQRTDDYWKGAVAEYASLYSVQELSVKRFVSGFLDSRTEAMLGLLDVPPDPILLDLACGTGAHMALLPKTVQLLRERGMDDVLVAAGGIIPDADVVKLKEVGVAEIFGPGTSIGEIARYFREHVRRT